MTVKIFSINDGLEIIENVRIIRIKSKDYNLLILKDYFPIIGEIVGSLEIENDETTKKLSEIQAYYVSQNNHFEVIIKELANG